MDFTSLSVHSEPRRGLNRYLMNQLIILSKLVSDFTTYQDGNLQCLHECICLCICLGRVASCTVFFCKLLKLFSSVKYCDELFSMRHYFINHLFKVQRKR